MFDHDVVLIDCYLQVASDDDSAEDSDENSATEISTDSEFEHDGTTPTQHEIPEITINDSYVRKSRGNYVEPKKVQVKSHVISPVNGNLKEAKTTGVKLDFSKINAKKESSSPPSQVNFHTLQSSPKISSPSPLVNPRKGDYLLNRTHSTEGIASKLSLELKKRYLLGSSAFTGSVVKSGSTSNVDTKLRSVTDVISQHQKLLNPASEPSPTMQAFLHGTNKLRSPLSPTAVFSTSPLRGSPIGQSPKILSDIGSNKSDDLAETPEVPLPDLLKETSIMKSRTEPNIVHKDSQKIVDRKLVEKIVTTDIPGIVGSEVNLKTEVRNEVKSDDAAGYAANESMETRPRSPLHETSIIVPKVDWTKSNNEESKEAETSEDSEMDSDSLSSSETELDEPAGKVEPPASSLSPPRLQIHSTSGELLLDEETGKDKETETGVTFEPDSIECFLVENKESEEITPGLSRTFENRAFGSGKIAEETESVNNNLNQLELKDENRKTSSNCSSPTSVGSGTSNKQDDSEENDITTAALTETEFSEWARDGEGLVSEDLRDVEFNINPEFITKRRPKVHKYTNFPNNNIPVRIAKEEDVTDLDFNCKRPIKGVELPVNHTSELLVNGEDIDFMDTDNESLLDDSLQDATNTAMLKNRGYMEFVNIKASTPANIQIQHQSEAPIAETEFDHELCSEDEQYKDENVIEIIPITMDDIEERLNSAINKNVKLPTHDVAVPESNTTGILPESSKKEICQSMEEDSLLVVEPAEDTTTSEIITVLASPINLQPLEVPTKHDTDATDPSKPVPSLPDGNNPDYLEYVKRLQSRIAEFSNAKDSIDVRKGRRKSSKTSSQLRSQEMIAEEVKSQEAQGNNSFNSPATSRKLEEITRERSKQKYLIQDILMDKLQAHKLKSAEKKAKRAARSSSFSPGSLMSPVRPFQSPGSSPAPLQFIPTSITTPTNSPVHTTFAEAKKALDLEAPVIGIGELSSKSESKEKAAYQGFSEKTPNSGTSVMPVTESEARQASVAGYNTSDCAFRTPKAPPRIKHEEAKRTAEKAKQDARARARLKSDEDLGLSPEDKIKELRLKVARRQFSTEEKRKADGEETPEIRTRRYSFSSLRPGYKLQTSKSTDNVKAFARKVDVEPTAPGNAKSMDELVQSSEIVKCESDMTIHKREKKKSKDPERRKSIIQAVSDFFKKKESSPSPPNQKDKFSRFRLNSKSKEKGKVNQSKVVIYCRPVGPGMIYY